MSNLTYILGAGASFNAIPIVSEFKKTDNFLNFRVKLQKILPTGDQKNTIINKFNIIIDELQNEFSIDTLIRKKSFTDVTEIGWYYSFLKTFILYFHVYEDDLFKKVKQDNRYEALITALTGDSRDFVLPSNIKILSWNYDFQLENAILNFTKDINKTRQHTKRLLSRINGGILDFDKEGDFINFDLPTKEKTFSDIIVASCFYSKSISSIKFALNSLKIEITSSKQIIDKSDDIVIVGYSFPTYNRVIDSEIFSNLKSSSKLYIQDLLETIQGIKEKALSIMPNNSPTLQNTVDSRTKLITNTSEFYIPFDWNPEYD
jgi:hypothetical protein